MTAIEAPIRVRICDPDHPHYPESGELLNNIIVVGGSPMAEVKLENCRHGTGGCFAMAWQLTRERRRPHGVIK